MQRDENPAIAARRSLPAGRAHANPFRSTGRKGHDEDDLQHQAPRAGPALALHVCGSRAGGSTIPEIHSLESQARNGASSPAFRKRYLAALHAHYEHLLRWKIGYMQYAFYFKWMQNVPTESQALIREAIQYGKERGIDAMIYAESPFAALVSKHPEVKRTCLPAGRPSKRARQLTVKYDIFGRRLAKEIPEDATFCVRETVPEVVRRYREIIGPRSSELTVAWSEKAPPRTASPIASRRGPGCWSITNRARQLDDDARL